MVARIVAGDWARGALGFLLGAELAGASLVVGQHAAAAFWHAQAHACGAAGADADADAAAAGGASTLAGEPPPPPALERPTPAQLCAEDVAAAIMLAAAVAGCVAGLALSTDAAARAVCLAALCSPAGVLARWQLSRWNGAVQRARWLPAGTLAANVAACVLDAALGAGHARGELGRGPVWGGIVNDALQAGIGGGLSTVSTAASETALLLSVPGGRWRGYAYLLLTWAASFAPAAAIFGGATRR
jgi:fluoride ion exporter CrcB/FEX